MQFLEARQAVKDINARGGVGGKMLEVKEYDDAADPKQAVAVANRVVNDGVRFLIGHVASSATQPASDVYEDEGVLMITPAATSPEITDRGYRLVFRAGFAALPRLMRLASRSARARGLAGTILRRVAGHHGCDDLLANCADEISGFRELLDRHLRSRPVDYLAAFLDSLAAMEEYHWSAVLGDFTDDFYHLACPHCAVEVTITIGDHGRYSAIRNWNLGDVDRRDLRPVPSEALSGTGRWMYETAVRDGREALADGIAHLFGKAECPRCASVFDIAAEYTSANRPVLR